MLRLRNLALEGKNPRAFDEVHHLIKAYQSEAANDDLGYIVVPGESTAEEWIARAELLNDIMAREGIRNLAEAAVIDCADFVANMRSNSHIVVITASFSGATEHSFALCLVGIGGQTSANLNFGLILSNFEPRLTFID